MERFGSTKPHRWIAFLFWSLADVFFLLLSVSYLLTARKGNPAWVLIIFLHPATPPLRSLPRHQQSHPENQFAQEAGLYNSGCGYWCLHHTLVALHFPMNRHQLTKYTHCNSNQVYPRWFLFSLWHKNITDTKYWKYDVISQIGEFIYFLGICILLLVSCCYFNSL